MHAPSRAVAETGTESFDRAGYEDELRRIVQEQLSAREVVVFDHTVRLDDSTSERRPARDVHADYSEDGARQRLVDLLGPERARSWSEGHFAFVNLWRPLFEPVNSTPLGFVRPRSVATKDWVVLDLVYPDRVGQIMGLVHNPAHEWVYFSKMTPDEIVLFNIFDSEGRASIAHSALDLVEDPDIKRPRKSIESRTVVRF
ncbi:MAG: CmcJ/NvfI family oxidoreductase, partial [Myxococcota bacterium]